ncbi:MAG TPA: pyroglutamyl-peptidase I [Xanthobacteraceae bacterium]|nr:pyroglutamyl-peptidase I [Xanthobacteraceae bacterium]
MAAPRILVAGFGPFPGVVKNPSGKLALTVTNSKKAAAAGVKIVGTVIPTVYKDVASILPRLLRTEKPDAVLMFGLAGSTPFMRIETRAANFANHADPDAAGKKPNRSVLVAGAPKILKVRAPVRRLLAAARGTGVKAELSSDAGGYICNAAFFYALDMARRTGAPELVAFVHIPWPRGQSPRGMGPRAELPSITVLNHAGEKILLTLIAALRGKLSAAKRQPKRKGQHHEDKAGRQK